MGLAMLRRRCIASDVRTISGYSWFRMACRMGHNRYQHCYSADVLKDSLLMAGFCDAHAYNQVKCGSMSHLRSRGKPARSGLASAYLCQFDTGRWVAANVFQLIQIRQDCCFESLHVGRPHNSVEHKLFNSRAHVLTIFWMYQLPTSSFKVSVHKVSNV